MALRIKDNIPIGRLREFGFAPGKELAQNRMFQSEFKGAAYCLPWWHKFAYDGGEICRNENEIPMVHAWIDTRDGKNLLWFDAVPCCTYHIEMEELDMVTETVFELTKAGLLEKSEYKYQGIGTGGICMERIRMTDVVSLLGLPQPPASRSSYYVRCPCCDGEHNRHLNINLKKEVFRCAKCGASGGIFDLYALFTGTDRDRVWRELTERLRRRPPLPE